MRDQPDVTAVPIDWKEARCERFRCRKHGTYLVFSPKRVRRMASSCAVCGGVGKPTGSCRAWTPQQLPYITEPVLEAGLPGQSSESQKAQEAPKADMAHGELPNCPREAEPQIVEV